MLSLFCKTEAEEFPGDIFPACPLGFNEYNYFAIPIVYDNVYSSLVMKTGTEMECHLLAMQFNLSIT